MPIVNEILEWVNENTRPNNRYKYSRCVICRNAWWDNQEQHSYDCWVPRLKSAELAATVPPVGAANNRSDEIADIASSMESAAKVTVETDPSVVQCAIGGWVRQLRAVR